MKWVDTPDNPYGWKSATSQSHSGLSEARSAGLQIPAKLPIAEISTIRKIIDDIMDADAP